MMLPPNKEKMAGKLSFHVAYPRGPLNTPFWTKIFSTWNCKNWFKTIIEYEKIVTILDEMDGGYESIHSKLTDLAIGAKDDTIPIEKLREFSDSIGDLPSRSLSKSQFVQQQRTSIVAQNIC